MEEGPLTPRDKTDSVFKFPGRGWNRPKRLGMFSVPVEKLLRGWELPWNVPALSRESRRQFSPFRDEWQGGD